jgi:predicted Zn finger-like uncharacterized protein
MSLLTQCPACQTYYRVVPDQLRISDGWVKCGNCTDIFDASAHLIEIDSSSDQADSKSQLEAEPEDKAVTPQVDTPALRLDMPVQTPTDIVMPPTDLKARSDQADPVESEVSVASEMDESVERTEPVWVAPDTETDATPVAVPQLVFPEDEPALAPYTAQEPQAERWDDPVPSTSDAMPLAPMVQVPADSLTFLRSDQRPSVWQKPLVRGASVLLVFGLLLLLAGQWVYRERDRLASSHPELKPALQRVCAWMNCEVKPVRQVDALLIDSVAFSKLDTDTYKLSFLVKNTSDLPLAYPAVELVLTDPEDQPAYRRVLSSSELGYKATELAANSDWAVTVALRIDTLAVPQRVSGYRLLVFYP